MAFVHPIFPTSSTAKSDVVLLRKDFTLVVTKAVLFFLLISGISGISVAQDNTGQKNADTASCN